MSDGDLVRETLTGRPAAFGDLARRWSPRVTAFCAARVRRPGTAEDLAQEALLRGFRSLAALEDPEKFGAWLLGIAHRTCLDWLKAKERTQRSFSEIAGDGSIEDHLGGRSDPEPEVEREDEARRLLREVDGLDGEHREVLFLYYYDDMKYSDIARILGVSPATVNARLTRARAILRKRLNGSSG